MDKAAKKQINRRTEEEKLCLIEQWEKSDLPIATFCRRHHLSDSLFHAWLNKYRRHKVTAKGQNDFIALKIATATPAHKEQPPAFADILLSDGKRIKLYEAVAAEYLRTLLS